MHRFYCVYASFRYQHQTVSAELYLIDDSRGVGFVRRGDDLESDASRFRTFNSTALDLVSYIIGPTFPLRTRRLSWREGPSPIDRNHGAPVGWPTLVDPSGITTKASHLPITAEMETMIAWPNGDISSVVHGIDAIAVNQYLAFLLEHALAPRSTPYFVPQWSQSYAALRAKTGLSTRNPNDIQEAMVHVALSQPGSVEFASSQHPSTPTPIPEAVETAAMVGGGVLATLFGVDKVLKAVVGIRESLRELGILESGRRSQAAESPEETAAPARDRQGSGQAGMDKSSDPPKA